MRLQQRGLLSAGFCRVFAPAVFTLLAFGWTSTVVHAQLPPPLRIPLVPVLVSQVLSLTSLNGNMPTSIEFENDSVDPVDIFWIDYSGQAVLYSHLLPGQSYVQQTYVTHPWVIYDDVRASYVMGFLPISQPGIAFIAGTFFKGVTGFLGDQSEHLSSLTGAAAAGADPGKALVNIGLLAVETGIETYYSNNQSVTGGALITDSLIMLRSVRSAAGAVNTNPLALGLSATSLGASEAATALKAYAHDPPDQISQYPLFRHS